MNNVNSSEKFKDWRFANFRKILKVLKNEAECIRRQGSDKCPRSVEGEKSCQVCDLCLPAEEILEVYDFLIEGYELLLQDAADGEEFVIRAGGEPNEM